MIGQRFGVLCRGVGGNPVRDIVVVTAVAVMVRGAVILIAGGNGLRVEVRTKVVSRKPKSGVGVAEQCG